MRLGMLLCAGAALAIGCSSNESAGTGTGSDTGTDASDGTDGTAGTDGTEGGSGIDTSAFEGRVAWTVAGRQGVFVRDLRENALLFERRVGNETGEGGLEDAPSQPALSPDGTALAYTLETQYTFRFLGVVHRVDLATGDEVSVPTDTGTEGERRYSMQPSLSQDGTRVAFTQLIVELDENGDPTGSTNGDIAVWDLSGDPVVLTTHDEVDELPMITTDGSMVYFVSRRDESKGDIYRVAAAGGSAPERVTVIGKQDIESLRDPNLPGAVAMSDDGARLVFIAKAYPADVDGPVERAFVLDTSDGSVGTVGTVENVQQIDISADGGTIALLAPDPESFQGTIFVSVAGAEPTKAPVAPTFLSKSFDLAASGDALAVLGTNLGAEDLPDSEVLYVNRVDETERVSILPEDSDRIGGGIFEYIDYR